MCGILGLASIRRISEDEGLRLRQGLKLLSRRGPDQLADAVFADGQCHFGHARLSIIDLHPRSNQPMNLYGTDDWIAFNGEIYNFRELKADLEREGQVFTTHGDTEVLLAAIARWGVFQACRRIDGMFAFAAYSARQQRLTLARDRYGEKPLYWFATDETVGFASTATALAATLGGRPAPSEEAMQLFLTYGFIPAPLSIYESVHKALPGEILEFDLDGAARLVNSWMLPLPEPSQTGRAADLDAVQDALDHSVSRRLVSDRPVGLFLSGGIDSSCVAASLKRNNATVESFTFRTEGKGYDESADAAIVAKAAGLDLTLVEFGDGDLVEGFRSLPDAFDEPHADASAIPLMRLSQVARSSATVVLTGDGGDEVFCGYHRHLALAQTMRIQQRTPSAVREIAASVVSSDTVIRIAQMLRQAFGSEDGEMFAVRMNKLAASLLSTDLVGAYLNAVSSADIGSRDIRLREMLTPLTHRSYALQRLDCAFYLPNGVLTKTDRATMYHGIEGRTPYLEAGLHTLAWGLDPKRHMGPSGKKLILRQLANRSFGSNFANRPKRGFDLPIVDWMNGKLRQEVEQGCDYLSAYQKRRGSYMQTDHSQQSAQTRWRAAILGHWLRRWGHLV